MLFLCKLLPNVNSKQILCSKSRRWNRVPSSEVRNGNKGKFLFIMSFFDLQIPLFRIFLIRSHLIRGIASDICSRSASADEKCFLQDFPESVQKQFLKSITHCEMNICSWGRIKIIRERKTFFSVSINPPHPRYLQSFLSQLYRFEYFWHFLFCEFQSIMCIFTFLCK